MADDDLLKDGKEKFTLASDGESDNRTAYEDDIRFARHEEQWPADIRKQRELEGRPVLTISKLNAFSRQRGSCPNLFFLASRYHIILRASLSFRDASRASSKATILTP